MVPQNTDDFPCCCGPSFGDNYLLAGGVAPPSRKETVSKQFVVLIKFNTLPIVEPAVRWKTDHNGIFLWQPLTNYLLNETVEY